VKDTAVGKLSGACETQAAREWIAKRSGGRELNPVDCGIYVAEMSKEVQERQTKEWQNKLDRDTVKRVIKADEAEYRAIQVNARSAQQQRAAAEIEEEEEVGKSRSKYSREEAVAMVREKYPETQALDTYDNVAADCVATWNRENSIWRVICQRPGQVVGDLNYEFRFTFYLVRESGEVQKRGNYVKYTNTKTGEVKILGKPMWGVL